MGRRQTRASMTKKEDREKTVYTGLPDAVINMIMCLMTSKLAARASTVNRNWGSVWSSVNVLNFEEDDFQPGSDDRVRQRKLFMAFLRRCFKCRDKVAKLEKFRLRMRFLGGDKMINKWLRLSLKRNAKELDIGFKGPNSRLYYFSWAVFSFARSLAILKLENVRFRDNLESISLPCLKILDLNKIVKLSKSTFSQLIWACPSLEALSLASCSGSLLKISSSTLKSLKIFCCKIKIKVEAQNLEVFKVVDKGFEFMRLSNADFDISSCRKLKNIEFDRTRFVDKWFEGLDSRFPLLEDLTINCCMITGPINLVSRSLHRFFFCDWRYMTNISIKAPNLFEAKIVQEPTLPCIMFPIKWLIGNFDHCEKMELHVIDGKALIFPEEIRNTSSVPLPRVWLLKVEISTPTTEQIRDPELEKSLRWMAPLLTCLSINHK